MHLRASLWCRVLAQQLFCLTIIIMVIAFYTIVQRGHAHNYYVNTSLVGGLFDLAYTVITFIGVSSRKRRGYSANIYCNLHLKIKIVVYFPPSYVLHVCYQLEYIPTCTMILQKEVENDGGHLSVNDIAINRF